MEIHLFRYSVSPYGGPHIKSWPGLTGLVAALALPVEYYLPAGFTGRGGGNSVSAEEYFEILSEHSY